MAVLNNEFSQCLRGESDLQKQNCWRGLESGKRRPTDLTYYGIVTIWIIGVTVYTTTNKYTCNN